MEAAVTDTWETVSAACSALIAAARVQGEGRSDDDELQELPSSMIARSFSLSKWGLFGFSFLMFPWSTNDDSPPLKLEVLHEFSWAFRPNDLRGVLTRSADLVGSGKRRWARQ